MSNCFIGSNNLIDRTFNGQVVFGGGSWQSALPITNLQNPFLVNVAQSTDTSTAATQFEFDMLVNRSMRHTFIPANHNLQRSAQYRVRYTTIPMFSGCTINANMAIGSTSVVFMAGAEGATIDAGCIFKFGSDTTLYTSSGLVTIAPNGLGTINITPALAVAVTAGEAVHCHCGDYSTPTRDSGIVNAYPVVFDILKLTWGDPHIWDGRYTNEELATIKQPIIDYSSTPFLARFGKIELMDTSNTDGFIYIARLFVSLGYIPTLNMIYGAKQGFTTTTKVNTSLGDAEFFEVRGKRRTFTFDLNDISENEALSNSYEIVNFSGIDKQLVFCWNPDDTIHLPRRTVLGRFQTLNDSTYAYFGAVNTPYSIIEVIA